MNTHLPVSQSLLHGEPSLEALHREAYYASKSEQAEKTGKVSTPAIDPSMDDSVALIRAKNVTAAGSYFA